MQSITFFSFCNFIDKTKFQRSQEIRLSSLFFMLVLFIPRKESIHVTLFSNDILFAGKQPIAFVLFSVVPSSASHNISFRLHFNFNE